MAKPKNTAVGTDFTKSVERAPERAYGSERETSRMTGTPLVGWRDGKVVLEKP
jgi:hypothetical protein